MDDVNIYIGELVLDNDRPLEDAVVAALRDQAPDRSETNALADCGHAIASHLSAVLGKKP